MLRPRRHFARLRVFEAAAFLFEDDRLEIDQAINSRITALSRAFLLLTTFLLIDTLLLF